MGIGDRKKYRIHFTVNGVDDSIDMEGDSITNIQEQWAEYSKDKQAEDIWSEEIE
ncbi:MAG: hypothetical protein KAS32_01675 [Candidatus Peribacteraceae bacterium]|nr:hypothetical protein [Candidatus Peribacteraceae bacterium]